jgi:protein-arginine kinase
MEEKLKSEQQNTSKEKLSYEDLQNVATQLSNQNRQLYNELQKANMTNAFKRLDYLFKVIENRSAFSAEFVKECVSEITLTISIPESENESE